MINESLKNIMNGKEFYQCCCAWALCLLWASCADDEIKEIVQPEEPTESVDPNPEPETPVEAKLPILRVEGRYLKNEKGRNSQSAWFYADLQPFLQ